MKQVRWVLPILFAVMLAAPLSARAEAGPTTGSMSLLHVRIVRLSFVQGAVAVRRTGQADWSEGAVNTPLEEGFSVATSANSFAEVEFENGSTARLGQDSEIDFTELALTQQGDRINKLVLAKGYATFHFTPEHHDQYEVDASGLTITVHGKTEFRTNFSNDALRVEVFDGQVRAEHDGKTEDVGKNRILTFDSNAAEALNVTPGIQKDAWDKWTKARDQQAVLAMNDESLSPNRPLFGWSDLDTYGAWSFFPGYGYGWAPYEPAGWSPYSAGMWGYYPGWGFTWISAEPWGWLPYHNGFWNYDASMGWFWTPGALDAWSPALVDWYDGPGWIGWAPVGNGGGACSIATPGCLIAVAPTTLEQGTPLRPKSPIIVHPIGIERGSNSTATRITSPQLSSAISNRSVALIGPRVSNMRAAAPGEVAAAHIAAPSSVVMGRQVSPDAFLHHGFLSGPQAIHAPLGRTMGGIVPTVVTHNGEISLDSRYHGPRPTAASTNGQIEAGVRASTGLGPARVPIMLARGNAAASAGPSINERGAISRPSGLSGYGAMPNAANPGDARGASGPSPAGASMPAGNVGPAPNSSAGAGAGVRASSSTVGRR